MSTAGGLADLHPEPGPGRAASDDDPLTPLPEDDSSVISLPPLATFTRGDASPVAWESEPRSSYGRRERSGLLSEAADDGLQVSSESGSPGGSRRGGMPPPPPPEPPVSRAQVAVIGLACFCTFGMGGVVFGISSLYPVLYAQGYWRAICNEAAASVCTGHSTKCCEAQLVRYSLVASRAETQRHGVPQPCRTHRARLPAACVPEAQGSLPRSGGTTERAYPAAAAPCVVAHHRLCLCAGDNPPTLLRTTGRLGGLLQRGRRLRPMGRARRPRRRACLPCRSGAASAG
jgi:hypothetical protein